MGQSHSCAPISAEHNRRKGMLKAAACNSVPCRSYSASVAPDLACLLLFISRKYLKRKGNVI